MEKHIDNIKSNYQKLEEDIVTQLNLNCDNNFGTVGSNREKVWEDLFKRIVPKKFNVERTVFIIDSMGNCSKEVDIVIYDESYTPYIFNYGVMKFIPIEAVAAVVQCKSHIDISGKMKNNLNDWTRSIDKLRTSSNSVVRTVNSIVTGPALTQKATRPIKILCYMKNFKRNTSKSDKKWLEYFDITMIAALNTKSNEKRLNIFFSDENENLWKIFKRYNFANAEDEGIQAKYDKDRKLKNLDIKEHYSIKPLGKHNLLSFIFQFNQMLMLINNPMFFPHKAYVDMFNQDIDKEKKNNVKG